MRDILLFFCILFPFIMGGAAFLDKTNQHQGKIVSLTGTVLIVASLWLAFFVPSTLPSGEGLAGLLSLPIAILDFFLLAIILFIGLRQKHNLVVILALIQFLGMIVLEFLHGPQKETVPPAFTLDSLAITLVLVVSIVGSLIAKYALGYMKEHEEHLHIKQTARPRFFAIILLFLGAMNGLALSDNLSWVYFFWEITTLCSYLLISHDQTDEAKANALKALWMNMAGGVAFVFALLFLQQTAGTLSISELITIRKAGTLTQVALMIPVVGLCFAGFTKSAQLPFQSWLCGAMVAPTPVSALLHSSTMVKAGVYLILRLTPLYADSSVSSVVAVAGAFTFIVTAALAVGQSNGKKILAYSTISNLGLIIACAGINTPASIAAGLMLLVFHACSKGLLFLCVGTIEQRIGSRDIEDMRGLFTIMPRTALLTAFGIATMMLPPFGMLLGKWMALESSVEARAAMPIIVAMLALGSGLTVLFWARWMGVLLGSANPVLEVGYEEQDENIKKPLVSLGVIAAILSFLAPILYVLLIQPAALELGGTDFLLYTSKSLGIGNNYGAFAVYPIYLLIGLGCWYAWKEAKKNTKDSASLPYMSGMHTEKNGEAGFIGPMKSFVNPTTSNYYLASLFGEERITRTANTIALVLLAMLLGGVMQ